MSISRVGRASRIAIIGTSVCPPAITRAPSSAVSHPQASSISAARQYSNGAAFMKRYARPGLRRFVVPPPPGRAKGRRCRGCDIVDPSTIWLKFLSHYRNRKMPNFAGRCNRWIGTE